MNPPLKLTPVQLKEGVTTEEALANLLRATSILAPSIGMLIREIESASTRRQELIVQTQRLLMELATECHDLWEDSP